MKDTVLPVNLKASVAITSADDGLRYSFAAADWKAKFPSASATCALTPRRRFRPAGRRCDARSR